MVLTLQTPQTYELAHMKHTDIDVDISNIRKSVRQSGGMADTRETTHNSNSREATAQSGSRSTASSTNSGRSTKSEWTPVELAFDGQEGGNNQTSSTNQMSTRRGSLPTNQNKGSLLPSSGESVSNGQSSSANHRRTLSVQLVDPQYGEK